MNKTYCNGLNLAFSITALLLSLTGCRFGNHSESAVPLKSPEQYRSIELFFTAPKTFTTRVYLNSLGGPDMVVQSNSAAPLSSIPSSILNVLSNPVYLAIPVNPNVYPIFRDNQDTTSLATDIDAQGNIAFDYLPSNGPFALWSNPNCLTNFEIIQNGTLDRTRPGTIQYTDGTTAPVAGELNYNYTFSRIIESVNGTGNCDDDLNRLAFCYHNGTGCTADELAAGRSLFDLYVRQTGVLNIQDASKIKALEYIVHYE
jgi:hypothetical protein